MAPRPTKPVIDFDHTSPAYAHGWRDLYEEMRQGCPVAWSESHGGYWIVSGYEDVCQVSRDDATFSSRKGPVGDIVCEGIAIPALATPPLLPIEVDPPGLRDYRVAMNPAMAPAAVEARRPLFGQLATWCVDQVIERGRIDFIEDLASPVPAMATMALVGLPLEHWRSYAEPFHTFAAFARDTEEFAGALRTMAEIRAEMYELTEERRRSPGGDLISRLTDVEVDGRLLSTEEIVGILITTLGGGVDTTTALIANSLAYLDEHPEHRPRLVADSDLMDSFGEEMLRYYSPVQGFGRTATRDVMVGDQMIAKGERVWISWAGANQDPAHFDRSDEIVLDRFPNRHTAFGVGAHRCVGSHLARAEFVVVMSEVLQRMPDYELVDGAIRYDSLGTVNGYHRLPARFTPGARRGSGRLSLA
jgi:cytochrome P450